MLWVINYNSAYVLCDDMMYCIGISYTMVRGVGRPRRVNHKASEPYPNPGVGICLFAYDSYSYIYIYIYIYKKFLRQISI